MQARDRHARRDSPTKQVCELYAEDEEEEAKTQGGKSVQHP